MKNLMTATIFSSLFFAWGGYSAEIVEIENPKLSNNVSILKASNADGICVSVGYETHVPHTVSSIDLEFKAQCLRELSIQPFLDPDFCNRKKVGTGVKVNAEGKIRKVKIGTLVTKIQCMKQ
jgi:hypothetical protein